MVSTLSFQIKIKSRVILTVGWSHMSNMETCHVCYVFSHFYVWVHGRCVLPSFSFRGNSPQHKTLEGLCGFANVSQASTGIAKSSRTVFLNKSLGHKRRDSLIMFDVWAHWISLCLEMQSQEEMNPLKRTPGKVLHFFLHLHHLSKSRSHSTSLPVEYIKWEGCRKCILKLFKSVADKYPGLNHSAGAELVLRQDFTSPCSRSYPGSSITYRVIMHTCNSKLHERASKNNVQ